MVDAKRMLDTTTTPAPSQSIPPTADFLLAMLEESIRIGVLVGIDQGTVWRVLVEWETNRPTGV